MSSLSEPPSAEAKESVLFVLCINAVMGGAEISMLTLAQGLRAKGYPVAIAIFGQAENAVRDYIGPEVKVTRIDAQRTAAAIVPLYRFMRRSRPDILITTLTPTNIIGILVAAATRQNIRIIATEHGPLSLDRRCLAGWQKILLPTIVGFLYAWADEIVAVSKGLADFVENIIPLSRRRPVRVIYNPVVREPFLEPPKLPHPWVKESAGPIVIGVGRLEPEKNFPLLIQAFARVVRKRPLRLIILGEGGEKTKLRALANDLGVGKSVLLPGFVTNVNDWLQCASVFVCSSTSEGFGNAIVEAMAYGLTVVSTDCPYGPSEILDHGRYGHLVPCGDEEAMAAALEKALDKPTDPNAVRARAAAFNYTQCFDAYDRLIGEMRRRA